jgi:transcriptional regulator with XRE-family HTH domain
LKTRAFFGCKKYKKESAKLIDRSEAIIDRLKELKVKSGMTSQQIAEKSKLPESTVTRIFSGKTSNPTVTTVIAIAKAMGGTSADIFDDTVKVDVVSEAPQVVVPQVDEKLYNEVINIYKDLLKIKDRRITTLFAFVGVLIVALVLVAIF